MAGWKNWQIGEVVEASDFQSFLQDQVVQVYDDSTQRSSVLGTAVSEGMVSFLKDTSTTQVYTSVGGWVTIGSGGGGAGGGIDTTFLLMGA
jgi:hypothetical protein